MAGDDNKKRRKMFLYFMITILQIYVSA